MAEVFSVAASAVGVADVAFRAIQSLSSLIAKLSNASDELRRLHTTLSQLRRQLWEIRKLREKYKKTSQDDRDTRHTFDTIDAWVKECVEDLNVVQGMLGSAIQSSDNTVKKFGKKIRLVYNEKEVEKYAARIHRHKDSIAEALLLLGRSNDLHVAEAVEEVKKQNVEHGALLRTTLDINKTSIAETRSYQRQIHQISVNNIKRTARLERNQTQLLRSQQKTHRIIATATKAASAKTSRSFDRLESMQHDILRHSEKMVAGQQSLEETLMLQFKQLLVDVSHSSNDTIIHGSAHDAAISLHTIYPHLENIFNNSIGRVTYPSLNDGSIDWLQGLLATMLGDVQERALEESKRKRPRMLMQPHHQYHGGRQEEHEANMSSFYADHGAQVGCSGGKCQREPLDIHVAWTQKKRRTGESVSTLELELPVGRFIVALNRGARRDGYMYATKGDYIGSGRAIFIPSQPAVVQGLTICIPTAEPGSQWGVKIPRLLSVFRTIPYEAEVWTCIHGGDIAGLRRLLDAREISPHDRNPDGNSLLCRAIITGDRDMCQLLLDQGADALDCNRSGRSGLSVLTKYETDQRLQSHEQIESLVRLLMCQPNILCKEENVKFNSVRGIMESKENALSSLLHCARNRQQAMRRGVAIRLLVPHCDLEEKGLWGRTPLLHCLTNLELRAVCDVSTTLLDAGANPLAIDDRGSSSLQLLLRQFGRCADEELDSAVAASLQCLLVRLLHLGCDPNHLNTYNYSPSFFALTPPVWPIWCAALQAAGKNIEVVLQEDDARQNLSFVELQLRNKYNAVLDSSPQKTCSGRPPKVATKPCFNCGGTTGWRPRRQPFDRLGSYLHSSCNAHQFDTSYSDRRHRTYWLTSAVDEPPRRQFYSPKRADDYGSEMGWRKHVAAMLWQNGVLSTPAAAQEWASHKFNPVSSISTDTNE